MLRRQTNKKTEKPESDNDDDGGDDHDDEAGTGHQYTINLVPTDTSTPLNQPITGGVFIHY